MKPSDKLTGPAGPNFGPVAVDVDCDAPLIRSEILFDVEEQQANGPISLSGQCNCSASARKAISAKAEVLASYASSGSSGLNKITAAVDMIEDHNAGSLAYE